MTDRISAIAELAGCLRNLFGQNLDDKSARVACYAYAREVDFQSLPGREQDELDASAHHEASLLRATEAFQKMGEL